MKKITFLMLIALITITTHGQNKLLSSIRESYSSYNNTWEKSYGTNYEYDSNNNLIAETGLRWADGVWKRSSIETYTYNASNKVTEDTYEDWNPETNEVDYKGRTSYSYTNGRLTSIESQEWKNSSWLNESKITVTYNSNNMPNMLLEFYWENAQWVNEERTTYTYNVNNILISSIFEEWNGTQWVNSEKTLYTYNAQNKITSQKSADWDEFNSNWAANGNQTEYEWDATGNQTLEIDYYKDGQGNINRYKDEYTYDTFNLMSSFVHPFKDKTGVDYFFEDFPYVNKVQVENGYSYNNQTNSFQLSGRTSYNYNSAITLSAPTIEKATTNISVYPNPARAFLNISNPSEIAIDKVFVTDMTGKKLLEQNNATQINVQNLAKGMYVLEAYSGNEKMQSKFIKD